MTAEASVEMSRPKADPSATPRDPAPGSPIDDRPRNRRPTVLDVNGVDTKLKAATAAVSRETSGIKGEDASGASRLGLKEGAVVEEADPDGGRRRVRILTPDYSTAGGRRPARRRAASLAYAPHPRRRQNRRELFEHRLRDAPVSGIGEVDDVEVEIVVPVAVQARDGLDDGRILLAPESLTMRLWAALAAMMSSIGLNTAP